MRRKKICSEKFTITVTEYEDSFDVVIDMPEGYRKKKAKTSHKKGTGDWSGTAGWIAGVLGMFEEDA